MNRIGLECCQLRCDARQLRGKAVGLLCPDTRPGEFGNGPAELLVQFARLVVPDQQSLAQISGGARTEKPAERSTRDNFLEGPANEAALSLIECWPDWPNRTMLVADRKSVV